MEDKDLFSYANSNDVVDEGEGSFDLNAFSSKSIEQEAEAPKKVVSKKKKVLKVVLSLFLNQNTKLLKQLKILVLVLKKGK